MFPTFAQLSQSTIAADNMLNGAQAARVRTFKAQAKACLQRCVAQDVRDGRYTKEQGAAFLDNRGAYGREGKKALGQ